MISFSDVSFTYTGTSYVLSDLSLSIEKGQFVCVLGENGSGKSTFSKLINALLVPDKGTVQVDGLDTSDPTNTYLIRSTAGMVFQNPDDQLVASLVENDVAFGPENLGIENPELRQRVDAALKQVGLQTSGKRETTALSGGQKQRVSVACALASDKQILVYDEPTSGLDYTRMIDVAEAIKNMKAKGKTQFIITHDPELIEQCCDYLVFMEEGRIIETGWLQGLLIDKIKNFFMV